MNYAADNFEFIERRRQEIKAELEIALTGSSAPVKSEEPKTEPTSWYGHDYDPA
jgi:hypothetical protein